MSLVVIVHFGCGQRPRCGSVHSQPLSLVKYNRGMTYRALILAICWVSAYPAAAQTVDFNRDIRPILADKCFPCHGPDAGARKADLRLDLKAGLFGSADSVRPFVPRQTDKSEALQRIQSNDPDVRMPPPSANKHLTKKQINLLTRWVKQGATWKQHWSFLPPQRPRLPKLDSQSVAWSQNAIDRFVIARLRRRGLQPMPRASSLTLIRRLHLDLIGLTPTPQAADYWLRELKRPGGYERLVDYLLASPAYGERWGREWLDLARYADTNGYEKDRNRSIWPYRDWVIRAINRDLPFDQFSIEQLAGDMLPKATESQRVATGFHRNTMLNEEGGIDPLEFRFHAMTDRVATTGVTWLGLTLGCAQCHSHKFDPVTQREYYQFMAFLNNADEPDLELKDFAAQATHRRNLKRARQLLKGLGKRWPKSGESLKQSYQQWLARQRAVAIRWQNLVPQKATANLPLLEIQRDHSIYASGDSTKQDRFDITLRPSKEVVRAIRLEAIPDIRLPARGPGMTFYEGTKGDFFLTELTVKAGRKAIKVKKATHNYAKNRYGHPASAQLAVDGDVQTGWSVHGRVGERHTAVFQLAEPIPAGTTIQVRMMFGRHFSSSLGRFRFAATSRVDAVAQDWSAKLEQLFLVKSTSAADDKRLLETFMLQAPQLKKAAAKIKQLQKLPSATTTLVMAERPQQNPRPTHIHRRGEFLQTVAKVSAATPAVLHRWQRSMKRDRLGLARWLVNKQNPLTARVVVNRHWASIFGRGIVETIGDFGLQGAAPTHPKLLDWLAVEFMELGWSRKQLHRLIVTSSTYQQQANADRSVWLRGVARKRLEAEVIRDSILQSAGALTQRIGGRPVFPPQPKGAGLSWGSNNWKESQGGDRYRRSIYIYLKRTAPFAMLRTFDAPSGESCVARRNRSNTALQALTILNDVMFVEAARLFAKDVVVGKAADDKRLIHVFRRVLTRPPTNKEKLLLGNYVKKVRARLKAGELDAKKIAGSGPNAKERAVWTALARVLFSLDENQTRN